MAPVNLTRSRRLARRAARADRGRRKSIDLRCERSDAVVVDGDAGWLQRLLLNLLDNALKFTRGERPGRRRGSRARATPRGSMCRTRASACRRPMRNRCSNGSSGPIRPVPPPTDGAGLGLSLVQWIAAQHRGTVTVQSRLGEGSTFTVTLPISRG